MIFLATDYFLRVEALLTQKMFKKFEFGHRKRFVKLQLSLKLYEVVEKQKSFRRKKIAIIFHLYNENTEDNVAIESSKAADEAAEIVLSEIILASRVHCIVFTE